MKITAEYIEKYANCHTNVFQSDILTDLERKTYLEVMRPQMLSGYLQGQLLSFLSILHKPERILEIGTYTGYSTICLAQGLQPDGLMHTIDINPEIKDIASEYIFKANLSSRVIQHLGDAMEVIPQLDEQWDLIFLDADKINYSNYFDLFFPYLKTGGLIIADNVLWHGHVVKGSTEKKAKALADFNQKINEDPKVKNI